MYRLQSPRAIFSVNVIKRSLVSLCLMAFVSTAYSFGFQGSQPSYHTGWVLARSVVRDNAGNVQWSTYDEQGKQSPLSAVCDETCVVMGAAEFNAWQQGFRDFKALALNKDLVQGAEWMTAEAFRQGKEGFKTVDGKQAMNVPPLQAGTHSVYVRSKKQWYTPDSRIVLFESPLDKAEMESGQALGATGSALLDKDGKVVARDDAKTIGLAVKWFDGEQAYGETPVPAGSRPSNTPLPGSTSIYGGIPGIIVEGPSAFGAFKTVTRDSTVNQTVEGSVPGKGEKGAYTLRYMVPCAPNDFVDYQSTLVARLPYSRFSPTAVYPSYTYATRLVSDYCNSVGLGLADPTTLVGLMVAVNAAAINATIASPQVRTPIYVDVLYITGRIQMKNADGSAVQFGGETRYDAINPTAAEDAVIGPFDFDGDGKADRSERGNVDAQQNFTPAPEGDKVGIYLSSDPAGVPVKNAQGQIIGHRPHFVRLIDKKMDPKDKGYTTLKTISIADLKATDIYLYRKSNGHLVKHQAGLTDTDIRGRDASLPTSGDVQWGYVMNYLGPQAWRPPARSWADLQNETVKQTDDRGGSSSVMYTDSALKAKREADHLRIGEELTVVIINRKTGYMGTHTAKVEAPGASGRSGLTVSDEPLILQPPNLKIMAVREYEVEAGATKGQMRSYNIGMEGAALKKDKYVEIDSLWLDENDQMLPEDLGARGYTGRLAKVAGDKLNNTQVSQFKIQPGLHKNMIKLGAGGQGDLGNEHYYLHVSGGVKDDAEAFRKPDFSTLGGDESGIWSSRPKWAVPFKVTTSREVQDLQEQMAYHDTRNNSEPNSEAPKSPQANYGWEYRPEFQFSVFDLQVKEITQCKGENGQLATDCISDSKNTFTIYNKAKNIDTAFMDPGMDLLKVIFELQQPKDQRLPGFAEPELILAMGASEHKITGSGALSELYDNLTSLALLDANDFLSIRLYMNGDAGNILWQYHDPIIAGVEITQVIQDYQPISDLPGINLLDTKKPYDWVLPVPLITGKPTAVRVYIQPHETSKFDYEVSVKFNTEIGVFRPPHGKGCTPRKQRDWSDAENCKSADFVFSSTKENDNIIEVYVNRIGLSDKIIDETQRISFSVDALISKELNFIPYQHCDAKNAASLDGIISRNAGSIESLCTSDYEEAVRRRVEVIKTRLPFASDNINVSSNSGPGKKVRRSYGEVPKFSYKEDPSDKTPYWVNMLSHLSWISQVRAHALDSKNPADVLNTGNEVSRIIVVHQLNAASLDNKSGGILGIGKDNSIVISSNEDWSSVKAKPDTLLHEFAHTAGAQHTNETEGGCDMPPYPGNVEWPYTGFNQFFALKYADKARWNNEYKSDVDIISNPEVGFDPIAKKPVTAGDYIYTYKDDKGMPGDPEIGARRLEIMAYCSSHKWISSYTYNLMIDNLYKNNQAIVTE